MVAVAVSDELREFVAKRMKLANCAAHDMAHCDRVANLAYSIALKEQDANAQIAYYGGLLHDVLDHKLYGSEGTEATEKELTSLLTNEPNMEPSHIDTIFQIIRNVGYKNMIRPRHEFDPFRLSVEYRCVQDADLLDAIGAIGVARCMAFSGRCNRRLFGMDLLDGSSTISREEYLKSQKSPDASAVAHFFEKLLRIKDLFTTVEGKALGLQRHSNMVTFLRCLDQELLQAGDESGGAIEAGLATF